MNIPDFVDDANHPVVTCGCVAVIMDFSFEGIMFWGLSLNNIHRFSVTDTDLPIEKME